MKLYLIRHGESMGNLQGKIQGAMDFPLSELGTKQVDLISAYCKEMKLDYIYSSDLTRAYDTAKKIGETTKRSVQTWDKIREVYLGPLQGLTRDEIKEKYPITVKKSIITSGIEGTETKEELTERCRLVLQELKQEHMNESVAIVSHGGFISILLMYILVGDKWSDFHRPFVIGNTSVTLLEWPNDADLPYLHYTNRTAHLDSLEAEQHAKKGVL
ncbi:histidine phosphatase family protein [Alkalicoccobacillus plakortidis]|uniref:Histidine phosphatase family protein n=1 Tax=Alkalicoccobacillus plakortidis TaxID=444060 RepID=A0ABT0XLI5_9BACI|nr:histidine phosphatase family protein [Alkalicoccobacillus plakortidis]MCM2676776.1 histidine phosphatase family protein [Alkalicoccobacillus plakortidis]